MEANVFENIDNNKVLKGSSLELQHALMIIQVLTTEENPAIKDYYAGQGKELLNRFSKQSA